MKHITDPRTTILEQLDISIDFFSNQNRHVDLLKVIITVVEHDNREVLLVREMGTANMRVFSMPTNGDSISRTGRYIVDWIDIQQNGQDIPF